MKGRWNLHRAFWEFRWERERVDVLFSFTPTVEFQVISLILHSQIHAFRLLGEEGTKSTQRFRFVPVHRKTPSSILVRKKLVPFASRQCNFAYFTFQSGIFAARIWSIRFWQARPTSFGKVSRPSEGVKRWIIHHRSFLRKIDCSQSILHAWKRPQHSRQHLLRN